MLKNFNCYLAGMYLGKGHVIKDINAFEKSVYVNSKYKEAVNSLVMNGDYDGMTGKDLHICFLNPGYKVDYGTLASVNYNNEDVEGATYRQGIFKARSNIEALAMTSNFILLEENACLRKTKEGKVVDDFGDDVKEEDIKSNLEFNNGENRVLLRLVNYDTDEVLFDCVYEAEFSDEDDLALDVYGSDDDITY